MDGQYTKSEQYRNVFSYDQKKSENKGLTLAPSSEIQSFKVGGATIGALGSLSQEEGDKGWCQLTLYSLFLKIWPTTSFHRMVPLIFKVDLPFSIKPL